MPALPFSGSTKNWDVEPSPYASGNGLFNCTVSSCATRSASESASIRINGQSGFLLHDNTLTQTARPAGQNGNILGGEWNKGLKFTAIPLQSPIVKAVSGTSFLSFGIGKEAVKFIPIHSMVQPPWTLWM